MGRHCQGKKSAKIKATGKQRNEWQQSHAGCLAQLLTVALVPPGCVQEILTVVEQELVVRVLHRPQEQGQQVPAVHHPAGGAQGVRDGARTASASFHGWAPGRPPAAFVDTHQFGRKTVEDPACSAEVTVPSLVRDAKIRGDETSPWFSVGPSAGTDYLVLVKT